jgi:hypothetical protein
VSEIFGYVGEFEGTWQLSALEGRKMGSGCPSQWELKIFKMTTFMTVASGWYDCSVEGI